MTNIETQKAMELVETTETTLRVTAHMLASATLLLKVGVEPRDGVEGALNMQLETFEAAISALNSLADVYKEIGDNNPIEEASSWS